MPEQEQRTTKATVAKATKDGKPDPRTQFEVQFNPTSLRLQTRNNVEGGRRAGRPKRSQNGVNTVTLSVELVFDTSDDGETDDPLDVQTLTTRFRRFVDPQARGSAKPPDPIWFHWGKFTFTGVVESLDEELEYFSFYGVALRSKLTLSIKQQDFTLEANQRGQGARAQPQSRSNSGGGGANDPPGTPGTTGDDRAAAAADALGGESAADFARRNGLPAAAWRAVTTPLVDDPLSLPAGIELPVPRSVNATGSVVSRRRTPDSARLDPSSAASDALGLGSGPSVGQGRPDPRGLGDAGGLEAAIEQIASQRAQRAAREERAARPSPATRSAGSTTEARRSRPTPAAAELTSIDNRATTYGFGVPLRDVARVSVQRRPAIGVSTPTSSAPTAHTASVPPWTALPATTADRSRADAEQRRRRPAGKCGCCTPPAPPQCQHGCHTERSQ